MRLSLTSVALALHIADLTTAVPVQEKHAVSTGSERLILLPRSDAELSCHVTAKPLPFVPLNMDGTPWIWTGNNSGPSGAFRTKFATPTGKCALCASIIVATSDNSSHTLIVNDKEIGRGSGSHRAFAFNTALQPQQNTFTIEGNNSKSPVLVAATILVHYADGSSDKIITDNSWITAQKATSFSDEHSAKSKGIYPKGQLPLPPVLTQHTASHWLWAGSPEAGTVFFRKVIKSPEGKTPVCAVVVMNLIGKYTFWANGEHVFTDKDKDQTEAYNIPNVLSTNVFAVKGVKKGDHAGFIATISVSYSDGTNQIFLSDTTWKASTTEHAGFESNSFNDTDWKAAVDKGAFVEPSWPKTLPEV